MHLKLTATLVVAIVLHSGAMELAQSISATQDKTGQHPGTAAIGGPALITCTNAVGNPGTQASCNITAPGFGGPVAKGKTVGASGAGTVILTCNGTGTYLSCSANIH